MKAELSKWNGKNVLCIGDSITSAGLWQKEMAGLTGCNVRTHAQGGIGLIEMVDGQDGSTEADCLYDPTTGVSGKLGALTSEKVGWANLIILLGAYNERLWNTASAATSTRNRTRYAGKFAVCTRPDL